MRNEIYASGLGLILFSPSILADVPPGTDFMEDLYVGGCLYDALVKSQKVVLLSTGSPQLTYCIRFFTGLETPCDPVLDSTEFGMWITRDLAIRDGYAPMEWETEDTYALSFEVPEGYYRVRALWVPRSPHSEADMCIDLIFEATDEDIPGNGWPILNYHTMMRRAE